MLGAILSLIALEKVENYLNNGIVEKKKRMGILIFGILLMFLIFFISTRNIRLTIPEKK